MPPGPQQQIRQLQAKVAALTAEVQQVAATRDQYAAQVAAQDQRIASLNDQIASMATQTKAAEARLAAVQPQLDAANQRLAESLDGYTKLGRAAGNLSNQLDQCNENFQAYRQSIADQTMQQQAEVKRWENTAWELQGAVRMLIGEKLNKDPLSVTEAELDEWRAKWVAYRQPTGT